MHHNVAHVDKFAAEIVVSSVVPDGEQFARFTNGNRKSQED